MQTPTLSGAQRAYMNDPEGFCQRMKRRAEELRLDGYSVEPGEDIGLFLVNTPKGEVHKVNILQRDCTCPFQQKAEIPQVPCKHIEGLEGLVAEMLADLHTFAELGDPRLAPARRAEYARLRDHWQAALDAAQCAEHERQTEDCELETTGCDPHARY